MNGRALTPEQKRAVIERLYAAWLAIPEQRLGQLMINASDLKPCPLFYLEDESVAEAFESYVTRAGKGDDT